MESLAPYHTLLDIVGHSHYSKHKNRAPDGDGGIRICHRVVQDTTTETCAPIKSQCRCVNKGNSRLISVSEWMQLLALFSSSLHERALLLLYLTW